jgi:hypothetical protein
MRGKSLCFVRTDGEGFKTSAKKNGTYFEVPVTRTRRCFQFYSLSRLKFFPLMAGGSMYERIAQCTLVMLRALLLCPRVSTAVSTVRDTKTERYGMQHAASQTSVYKILLTGRGEALASLTHAYLGSFLEPEDIKSVTSGGPYGTLVK